LRIRFGSGTKVNLGFAVLFCIQVFGKSLFRQKNADLIKNKNDGRQAVDFPFANRPFQTFSDGFI